MKKIKLFLILFFAITTGLFAQNQMLTVGNNGNAMNQTVLTLSNDNQTTIRFDLNQLELIEMATNYGTAFIPLSDKAPLMMQEGAPELFFFTASFIIPDRGGSELEISYGQYQDFENVEIAPSKGNLTRNIDPTTVPFVKGEVYQRDGFFPGTLASLRDPFIMRDIRGQSVDVYPIQYNPVTKVLRVYSEITISVINTRDAGINEFTTQKRHQTIEPEFNAMYNRLFINNSVVQQRGYPTGEEGELLIICHPAFMDAMKPYIDWKRTMGRKTTMVSTATSGTTATAIKSYIAGYYNNPGNNLAFVLFVGDAPQIPPYPASGAKSDIEYGKINSGQYLDVLIGRMSCENVAHVQTQVLRTITYERDLTTADTWVANGMGVAANEGNGNGHDGGEADYVHMNNIRTRMLAYGYNTVYQDYSGGCPGIPNTSPAQINQHLEAGASMLNYCNHGSETGWSVASYSTTNINQLQNVNKLPYLFLVACLNGQFEYSQPCFAEVFMRREYNSQPAGAIAVFGATISISWQPPMTAEDEFANIIMDLPSPYSGAQPGIKRTIAGAMLNASQKMQMTHTSTADYNSWLVFGDPTLNFRTKTPQTMTISHMPVILIGTNSFEVSCDANDAVATLSYIDNDDEVVIVGTAIVTGGVANINFNVPISVPMDLTLCVTGFNKVAHVAPISAIPPSGPYLVHNGYSVVDAEKLTYTATNQEIEVLLKNVGTASASGPISVNISCTDPQLTINTATAQYNGAIAPDGTATVKFNVTVAHDIVDGKTFPLDLTITATGVTDPWISKLTLKAFAPDFKLAQVLINDVVNGNLPIGNLAKITTIVENKGEAEAFSVVGKLIVDDEFIIIPCEDEAKREAKNLPAGESMSLDFLVVTSPNMPSGYEVNFDLLLNAMYGRTYTESFKAASSGSGNYCIPSITYGCSSNDRFTHVKLVRTSDQVALIDHDTPCNSASNGYIDHTNIVVPIEPGAQYTLTLNIGSGGTQYMKGWFDLNGNNAFETNEMVVSSGSMAANSVQTFNFTAPQDFMPGSSRFRLRCLYNSSPTDACSSGSYGQTLDYTIVLPELYPRVQNVEAELQGENIVITWQAPAEGTPVGYNIYRNGGKLNEAPLTDLTYTEGNIEVGVYAYNVTAVYTGNKESYSEMSNVICFFLACEKPLNLQGVTEGKTAILTWNTPENMEGTLLGYNIYRNGIIINEDVLITGQTYNDENLAVGAYTYQVSAVYEHCESELTAGISLTIEPEFCEPPTNLSVAVEEYTVVITWNEPENNIDGELLGYNIYRNEEKINEEPVTETEYLDEGLEDGTYTYQVSAVYEHCESDKTESEIVYVGINNIPITAFDIFPNPANGEVTIKGDGLNRVEIFDLQGRILAEYTHISGSLKINDLSKYENGIYFVRIYSETKDVAVKRLVIMK